MLDKIHILISILASVIILILSIIQRVEPSVIALRLVFVIIIFYVIGLYARRFLKKVIFVEKENDTEEEFSDKNDKSDEISS